MTKEEFNKFRSLAYPNTPPISHRFKNDYKDRRFRIHSLPKSKRYAKSENERNILLMRQNKIITDLFTDNSKILLVTGDYEGDEEKTLPETAKDIYKTYNLIKGDTIDLYRFNADMFDEGVFFRPSFTETIWEIDKHNDLLRAIADDETRALFVSMEKNVLVAPYDGGIDLILKDSETRDNYKKKYKQWLSERDDGL